MRALFIGVVGVITHSFADEALSQSKIHAAIDMGSGQIKLFVGRIKGKKVEKIVEYVEKVPLGEHLKDGILNTEIEKITLAVLIKLKKIAAANGAVEIKGLATEVFRKARNGKVVLERLSNESNIPLYLVSAQIEGEIGFNSVLSFTSGYTSDKLVVFESGSGSSQITFFDHHHLFHSISLPLGTVAVVKLFWESVRKHEYDKAAFINPVTLCEENALISVVNEKLAESFRVNPLFSNALKAKLKDPKVKVLGIGYGGVVGKALKSWPYFKAGSSDKISQEDFLFVISSLLNKSQTDPMIASFNDRLLTNPIVPSLTMLYTIMKACGFSEIEWKDIPAGAGTFNYFYSWNLD